MLGIRTEVLKNRPGFDSVAKERGGQEELQRAGGMFESVSTPKGLDAKLAGVGKRLAFYDTFSGKKALANERIIEGWLP